MLRKIIWSASLSTLILVLAGALAFRLGWLDFRPAFAMFVLGLLGGVLVGLISLGCMLFAKVRGKSIDPRLMLATAIALMPAALVFNTVNPEGFSAPLIHDISTDTENPPIFEQVLAERIDAENSADYEGEAIARQQVRAYPDIKSLHLQASLTEVEAAVRDFIQAQGWRIPDDQGKAAREGIIEAVASTPMMGFKDDIVFRLKSTGDGTIVDIRSLSRVGKGDLGANAKRVRAALEYLRNQFSADEQ